MKLKFENVRGVTWSEAARGPLKEPCVKCGGKLDDFSARFWVPACIDCCNAADAADPVSFYALWQPFSAVYQGERYRFVTGEHFNLGPGWMCQEIDGRLSERGIIASGALSDVQDADLADLPEWLKPRVGATGIHGDAIQRREEPS